MYDFKEQRINGKNILWILRCPVTSDAEELSKLRVEIDGETEYLDREAGEDFRSPDDYKLMIQDDLASETSLFLVAEVDGTIIGYTRCIGSKLQRFRHKADFGICILKAYWGHGIGAIMLDNIIRWADTIGLKKISLSVVQTNISAIQLYKKFGFIEEGLLINDRIHKDGNFYNTLIMRKIFY